MSTDFNDCILQGDRILTRKEERVAGRLIRPTDKGQETGWYEVLRVGDGWIGPKLEPGDRVMYEKGQSVILDGKAYVTIVSTELRLILPKGKGASRDVAVAPDTRPEATAP